MKISTETANPAVDQASTKSVISQALQTTAEAGTPSAPRTFIQFPTTAVAIQESTETITIPAADITTQAMTPLLSEISTQAINISAADTTTQAMTTSPSEISPVIRSSVVAETSAAAAVTIIPQISTQTTQYPLAISTSSAINMMSTSIALPLTANAPSASPILSNLSEYQKSESQHYPSSKLSMLATHHHTHSERLITLVSISIPTKSRHFDQLLPPTPVQWFSHNKHPVDHHLMHTHLFIPRSPTPIID